MRLVLCAALFTASFSFPVHSAIADAAPAGAVVSVGDPIALTFYVAPAHLAKAEAKAKSLQTIGSADYHHFLTRKEFVEAYAVSNAELAAIEGSLENLGFTIAYVYPNHLAIEVTGTVSTAENALSVKLKTVTKDGRTGIAPDRSISLPAELQGKVRSVGGLNTVRHAEAMHMTSIIPGHSTKRAVGSNNLVGGTPGNYLPADFARIYDVDPIYNQGYHGHGSTIGIITLTDFDTSDAYTFWKKIGLNVSQSRITKVDVDGGTTVAGHLDGPAETDLDVEYSGALAPGAKLRVYIAPNATSSFINAFEAAASENIADTLSVSWGLPELDFYAALDPASPSQTYLLDDFHDVFLEMAIQGQTLYAASGDHGAFAIGCSPYGTPSATNPVCNAPYAVISPANDPLVTAAGGTTLPFGDASASGFHLYNLQERAWGWGYIAEEAAEEGFGAYAPVSAVFSIGGGGGVSSYYHVPWYQRGRSGMTKTVPNQSLTLDYGNGPVVYIVQPSNFAGRNLPDISTNADPESGYQYIVEGSVVGGGGGTSFVAPQLNGVTALFVEALGTRLGQINPALYHLEYDATKDNYYGDNWGYPAIPGYDNATGIGTLDANNLLTGLRKLKAEK